ncbi:D-alanyl-lipoteichoic acid acyltransferase DltB (MBOAT superfamily) [Methylobacterium brachiatum]|jgi:alginate O-acetyltransferase complex protein AlgI|uniref:Probable alginate O-acetylase AlgI n=1 Tax=Methylobacterium brachiatum TaxID=269660 RepID=A0AAJ1TJ46_9HYPH|nr:MBOAT family O-acyltransferase [Methylobacterium brachiatum]MCB4803595.1 MBOAT family protein [Methylobacterium brachiatum]MDQ0542032.1 D-alanyl-lipoteichoic acid acyltransferase DltB (MBOAT superfamily) [Methylobacterium brachiatum]
MLFNSFVFLLAFLPAALILHALVARAAPAWRLPLLVVLSFVFYGWWDVRFVPLLAGSILANWCVARLYRRRPGRWLIPGAIAANLVLLGLFKYLDFFADLANLIPGLEAPRLGLALPLGISFFTFHHIMYLADLRSGRAPAFGLTKYALYIAFFPQVLAGPLVRWSEIMHQFDEQPYARPDAAERFARGLMLLTVGLAKKVFLGDPLAAYVNPVFQAAAAGKVITVAEAWQATLGFTFQIYFDFSGYTDMALGIALLFGLVLPQNFDAPYRATSLRDFWRRWHMTLSRFLRDYLYIPMGGNRRGLKRQVEALAATMTLGGLWHGAGLTFLAWGALHGLGLGAGVLARRARLSVPAPLGWLLTSLFVMLTWVLFRATSFEAALLIFKGLFGLAPHGSGFKWRTIAVAALVATVGPTAWAAVHRLPPRRILAFGFALLFVVVLLKIGDDANYEFIYFQF